MGTKKRWMMNTLPLACLIGLIACSMPPKDFMAVDEINIESSKEKERDAAKNIADELADGIKKISVAAIAILDFHPTDSTESDFGKQLCEDLTYFLKKEEVCKIIERRLLDQVLMDLKFTEEDIFNRKKVSKLGGFLQCDALLVGTYTTNENPDVVNARLISAETADVLVVARAEVDEVKSGNRVPDPGNGRFSGSVGFGSDAPVKHKFVADRDGYLVVEVVNLNKKGTKKGSIGKVRLLNSAMSEMDSIRYVKASMTKNTDKLIVSSGETYYIELRPYKNHRAHYRVRVILGE